MMNPYGLGQEEIQGHTGKEDSDTRKDIAPKRQAVWNAVLRKR